MLEWRVLFISLLSLTALRYGYSNLHSCLPLFHSTPLPAIWVSWIDSSFSNFERGENEREHRPLSLPLRSPSFSISCYCNKHSVQPTCKPRAVVRNWGLILWVLEGESWYENASLILWLLSIRNQNLTTLLVTRSSLSSCETKIVDLVHSRSCRKLDTNGWKKKIIWRKWMSTFSGKDEKESHEEDEAGIEVLVTLYIVALVTKILTMWVRSDFNLSFHFSPSTFFKKCSLSQQSLEREGEGRNAHEITRSERNQRAETLGNEFVSLILP